MFIQSSNLVIGVVLTVMIVQGLPFFRSLSSIAVDADHSKRSQGEVYC